MICRVCRVPVTESRARGWIHTEPVPERYEDHDADPADRLELEGELEGEVVALEVLSQARKRVAGIRETMRMLPGVEFSEVARDAVRLLDRLEELERA